LAGTKRVFLDANVLVAIAFRPQGQYSHLLKATDVHYVTSEHILYEVAENLEDLDVDPQPFLASLRQTMEVTDQVTKLPVGLPLHDDEDRQALAEAIGSRCDEFVTYNSTDFAALYGQTVYGVFIRHAAEFRRLHAPSEPPK